MFDQCARERGLRYEMADPEAFMRALPQMHSLLGRWPDLYSAVQGWLSAMDSLG